MATKIITLEQGNKISPAELEIDRGDTIEFINKANTNLQLQFCDSLHPFDQDVMFQKTITIKSDRQLTALVHSSIAFGQYRFYVLEDITTANKDTKLATLTAHNHEH